MPQFSSHYRTISVSLRHAYPESWDGKGNDAALAQHAADLAAFIHGMFRANPRFFTERVSEFLAAH